MTISFDSTLIPLAINKEVVFSLNQIKQHPKQKDRNTTNFAPLVKQFSSSRNVCKIKSAKISSIKQMIIFSQLLTKKYFPVQNKYYYGSIYSPVLLKKFHKQRKHWNVSSSTTCLYWNMKYTKSGDATNLRNIWNGQYIQNESASDFLTLLSKEHTISLNEFSSQVFLF